MPLRGSHSHWRVLGAVQPGSKYSARSGGVVGRSLFPCLLGSRNTGTSGQPPPVGGNRLGHDSLGPVIGAGALCRGDLCLAVSTTTRTETKTATTTTTEETAPSTTTATTKTIAAPSTARQPLHREEVAAAPPPQAPAIPSRRERRRNARRSANGDAIKHGGPVRFVTRWPGLV